MVASLGKRVVFEEAYDSFDSDDSNDSGEPEGKKRRTMESAVVTQTSQESGGETQSTSGATRARIHITAERTRQAGKGKQTNFKRLKKWKAAPPPVLFTATTFKGKSVEN